MGTRIFKVGGDSTGIHENLVPFGDFARREYSLGNRLVFVVSAQAGKDFRVTEALRSYHGSQDRDTLWDIIYHHRASALGVKLAFDHFRFWKLVEDSNTLAETESIGERLNAPFIDLYLRSLGLPSKYVSALDLLQERDGRVEFVGDFDSPVTVTEGFIYGSDGRLQTFPTGGSEISADIIAAGVGAEFYGILKNHPWFGTADPAIVQGAKRVPFLTFRELAELTYAGARAVHDRGFLRCAENDIPILIGSAKSGMANATRVAWDRDFELEKRPYAGIATKKGFIVYQLGNGKGSKNLHKIFQVFEEDGVSIDMVSTNGDISIAVHEDQSPSENLEKRLESLGSSFSAKLNQALVSVVGEGLRPATSFSTHLTRIMADAGLDRPLVVYGASPLPSGHGILEIEDLGMNSKRGYLAEVLRHFSGNGIPVTDVLTTVGSIGVQFPRKHNVTSVMEGINDALSPDIISVTRTRRGITASPRRSSNVTLLVPEGNKVVRALHRDLFRSYV